VLNSAPHFLLPQVLGCLLRLVGPALTVAAALSVQSPFAKLADDDEESRWGAGS
jgi:hypothetical protein